MHTVLVLAHVLFYIYVMNMGTALNHAITRPQRRNALQTVLRMVMSHRDPKLHNYEMECGLDTALLLKLGYIQQQQQHDETELDFILTTLHCVYSGCTRDRLMNTFREIGVTEWVPLLLALLTDPSTSESLALKVILLLRIFCKLDTCKASLINGAVLVETLVRLLPNSGTLLQKEILGCIKDLSFQSQDRPALFHTPTLIPVLVNLRGEHVAAIWWNFACVMELAHSMAQSPSILANMECLLSMSDSCKTRRSTLSALGNLASVHPILPNFVPILQSIVLQDPDTDCQRRAMRTIRCWALECYTQPGLIDFLSSVITSDDSHVDTKMQALESMAILPPHTELLPALITTVERATEPKLTMVACRIIATMTDSSLSERISLDFLHGMERAVRDDSRCHESISKVMNILSTEHSSSSDDNNDKFKFLLLTTPAMNILALLCERCMAVIQVLAETESNRRPMAEHDALLSSLVTFAMSTTDGPEKDNTKTLILKLVTEL
jgi:hypothetical protein